MVDRPAPRRKPPKRGRGADRPDSTRRRGSVAPAARQHHHHRVRGGAPSRNRPFDWCRTCTIHQPTTSLRAAARPGELGLNPAPEFLATTHGPHEGAKYLRAIDSGRTYADRRLRAKLCECPILCGAHCHGWKGGPLPLLRGTERPLRVLCLSGSRRRHEAAMCSKRFLGRGILAEVRRRGQSHGDGR